MSPSLLPPPPTPSPPPPSLILNTQSQSLTAHTLTRERGAKVFCLDSIESNIRVMLREGCNIKTPSKTDVAPKAIYWWDWVVFENAKRTFGANKPSTDGCSYKWDGMGLGMDSIHWMGWISPGGVRY